MTCVNKAEIPVDSVYPHIVLYIARYKSVTACENGKRQCASACTGTDGYTLYRSVGFGIAYHRAVKRFLTTLSKSLGVSGNRQFAYFTVACSIGHNGFKYLVGALKFEQVEFLVISALV